MTFQVATCKYDDKYLVYSDGHLYSSKYEKILRPSTNGKKSPYLSYTFGINSKVKKVYIHRLVAEHFLENPNNLRDVHHKDHNPHNNDVSNLEWMSHKDNCGLRPQPNPLKVIEKKDTSYIQFYKNGYYFSYKGNVVPKIRKRFKTFEDAKQYRDNYFIVQIMLNHNWVA